MKAFTILPIIQARMNSQRLPGKSLMSFSGRPSLGHLIDAAKEVFEKESITIATSKNACDDPVAAFAAQEGVRCFRGEELNVASRFYALAKESNADFLLRLNGDSPIFDFRVLEEFMADLSLEWDLMTTVNGNYPSGMNAEFINLQTFIKYYPSFSLATHFEHVTKYFYQNAPLFRIKRFISPVKNPEHIKFSIDTQEDFNRVQLLFENFKKPHFEYSLAEKCELYQRLFL